MTRSRFVTGVFLLVFGLSALLLLNLLWVFISAGLLAMVLVSLFSGVQARLVQKLNDRHALAGALTLLLIILVVVLPLSFFTISLTEQAFDFYQQATGGDFVRRAMEMFSGEKGIAPRIRDFLGALGMEITQEKLGELSASIGQNVGLFLYEKLSGLFSNVFHLVFHFGIMLILTYALLVDGQRLKLYVMDIFPLPNGEEARLMDRFKNISQAIFFGNGTASVLQGVFGGFGFFLFDLGPGVFWGAIIGFMAFLPVAGATAVFVPVTIYLFIEGDSLKALLFLVYNMIYVGLLEYGLKPRLIGGKARLPAILVFISVMAGLSTYGILGLFYGPLIIAMFLTLAEIYREDYSQELLKSPEPATNTHVDPS